MIRRIFPLICALLMLGMASVASIAQGARDYAIAALTYTVNADETTLRLTIDVRNQGAFYDSSAPVEITIIRDGFERALLSESVPALPANAAESLSYDFPIEDFEAGDELRVSVGVDNFELPGSQVSQNNIALITLDDLSATPATPDAVPAGENADGLSIPISLEALQNIETVFALEDETVILLDNALSRQDFLLGLGLVVGVLLALWILSLLLRLIFRRPPRFDVWQPPYSMMSAYDTDSVAGRRQAWQQHAQNGLIMAAPTENNVHVVKLLLGADGREMGNWKLKAMRLSQYDNYGRIARSQTLAQRKWLNRLNKALRKNNALNTRQLERRIRPVAKRFTRAFRKKINRKNAFLPISLDMRFEGKHGEVRIVFDLYQFGRGVWQRIDQWEPAMMLTSGRLQENYTYTIHGQRNGETLRDFRQRLQDDILWLLMETLRTTQPQQQAEVPQDTFSVPDTLTGMEPIRER